MTDRDGCDHRVGGVVMEITELFFSGFSFQNLGLIVLIDRVAELAGVAMISITSRLLKMCLHLVMGWDAVLPRLQFFPDIQRQFFQVALFGTMK